MAKVQRNCCGLTVPVRLKNCHTLLQKPGVKREPGFSKGSGQQKTRASRKKNEWRVKSHYSFLKLSAEAEPAHAEWKRRNLSLPPQALLSCAGVYV